MERLEGLEVKEGYSISYSELRSYRALFADSS